MDNTQNKESKIEKVHALLSDLPHLLITMDPDSAEKAPRSCHIGASASDDELFNMLSAFFRRSPAILEVVLAAIIHAKDHFLKTEGMTIGGKPIRDFIERLGRTIMESASTDTQNKEDKDQVPKGNVPPFIRGLMDHLNRHGKTSLSRTFVVNLRTGEGIGNLLRELDHLIGHTGQKTPENDLKEFCSLFNEIMASKLSSEKQK